MPPTSHIRQRAPGLVRQAISLEPEPPGLLVQLLDPPRVAQSPFKRVRRDTAVYKLTAECTDVQEGGTDTLFQLLKREPDPASPGNFIVVDLLNGQGVLPAGEDEVDWYPFPPIPVYRRTTRLAVNVTQVGSGVTGLCFEFLYTQQGLT